MRAQPVLLANRSKESRSSQEVAESLLIAVAAVAGLVVMVAMNLHGKARAFESAEIRGPERRPEAVTDVELPSPQFNRRDPNNRRGK